MPHAVRRRSPAFLLIIGMATLLTWVFFGELWQGYGLIGGDIYPYFLPQKTFYSAELAAGRLPLWNNLTGHGYPVLGESQTAALYPPNLLAYWLFDVNTAYNLVQLLHYWLAFVFTWLFVRRLQFGAGPALLAATVFTYGWFPARISLEWAIVTGCWLPGALWLCERFLQQGRTRDAAWLAVALGLQLLAGHYHLAFITHGVLVLYVTGRTLFCRNVPDAADNQTLPMCSWKRAVVGVLLAIVGGYALAAPQLVQSWELKQRSQRSGAAAEHDPGYGYIPLAYLQQVATPFTTYTEGTDLNATMPADAPPTNRVEAHLYFGLLPLLLIVAGLVSGVYFRDRRAWLWGLLALLSVAYALGWFLPVARSLPGFSFFRGAGRYGIVATLAAGLLAAATLERMLHGFRRGNAFVIAGIVLAVTVIDLQYVSRLIRDAIPREVALISFREQSPVAEILRRETQPPRVLATYSNVINNTGLSSVPVYLGLGPEEYFTGETTFPATANAAELNDPQTKTTLPAWLQQAGVTHVLSETPLDDDWPAERVWSGIDPFLHSIFGRSAAEPFYLYRLQNARGRIAWEQSTGTANITPLVQEPGRLELEVTATAAGQLVVTELLYPGWHVTIDEKPAAAVEVDGMYRGVDVPAGTHRVVWAYEPSSFRWGCGIALATLLLFVAGAFVESRRSKRPRTGQR